MSETSSENFNLTSEHEEISRLEAELEARKKSLSEKGESPFAKASEKAPERATAMPERIGEAAPPPTAATPPPTTTPLAAIPHEEVKKHAEDIKKMERSQQVDHLAKIAVEKGPQAALKIAQRLDNPWLLDQYHDTLTDELYQELLKRGHIKH